MSKPNLTVADGHIVSGKNPFIPDRWKVENHRETEDMKLTRDGENLLLNEKKIDLHVFPYQMPFGCTTKGYNIYEDLVDKSVLNACVLDYLLAHTELIPDSWKVNTKGEIQHIVFWGTIYRDPDDPCVRCLYWYDGQWRWRYRWIYNEWDDDSHPAAVLAG